MEEGIVRGAAVQIVEGKVVEPARVDLRVALGHPDPVEIERPSRDGGYHAEPVAERAPVEAGGMLLVGIARMRNQPEQLIRGAGVIEPNQIEAEGIARQVGVGDVGADQVEHRIGKRVAADLRDQGKRPDRGSDEEQESEER